MLSHNAPMGSYAKTLIIGIFLTCTFLATTAEEKSAEKRIPCDTPYPCSLQAPENPFPYEDHQQIYSVQLGGSLTLERDSFLYVPLSETKRTKSSLANSSVVLTHKSHCEFVLSFLKDNEGQNEPGLKVAMIDGVIKRTCYARKDVSDKEINVLKAFASTLQHAYQPTFSDISLEGSNRGTCLTKYLECPGKDFDVTIKYQSSVHCSSYLDQWDLLEHYDMKVADFQNKITGLSDAHTSFCQRIAVKDSTPIQYLMKFFYKDISGVSVCLSLDRGHRGGEVIKTAACYETQDDLKVKHGNLDFSIVVQHQKSRVIDYTPEYIKGPFYQTSLAHVPDEKLYGSPYVPETALDFVKNVTEIMELFINKGLYTFSSTTLAKKVQAFVRSVSSEEVLLKGLSSIENIPSDDMKLSKIYLDLIASEAKSQPIFNFFKKLFSDPSLTDKFFSMENYETVIGKIFLTVSRRTFTSIQLLEFTKFMNDFIFGENSYRFSADLRLTSIIQFSKHVDQFCNRKEVESGSRYCAENPTILKWIHSTVIDRAKESNDFLDEFRFQEGINMFHQHFNHSLCETGYRTTEKGTNQFEHRAILNCYRKRSCSKEAKSFFHRKFQKSTASENDRITAFLGIAQCLDDSDRELINNALKNALTKSDEKLATFISTYKKNRDYYGLPDMKGIDIQNVNLSNSEPSQSSNTFLSHKIIGDLKIIFETNVLYFPWRAFKNHAGLSEMIPNVITMKLMKITNPEEPLLEFEVYTQPFFTPSQEIGFNTTAIVRLLGEPLYIRGISVTKKDMLKLSSDLQKLISGNIMDGSFSSSARLWILRFIQNDFKLDSFEFGRLINEIQIFPTVAGTTWRYARKMETYNRIKARKGDCSDIFKDDIEATCEMYIVFETTTDMKSYFGLQSLDLRYNEVREEGFLPQSHTSISLPLKIVMKREKNENGRLEEIVTITGPASNAPLSNIQTVVLDVDVKDNRIEGKEIIVGGNNLWRFSGLLSAPVDKLEELGSIDLWSEGFMNIILRKTEKGVNLELQDPIIKGSLEIGSEPMHMIQGNLSVLDSMKNYTKTYSFKVGAKNTEHDKRLLTELSVIGDESGSNLTYLIDAYYIYKIKDTEDFRHHGVFSCPTQSGKGILCWWPFCFFCGSELSMGANVITPKYNLKLFEGSVKQVLPDKRIDIVLETKGIPVIRSGNLKVSLQRGDASVFHGTLFNDLLQERLKRTKSEFLQDPNGNFVKFGYLLEAELNGHLIGHSELSVALLNIAKHVNSENMDEFGFAGLTLSQGVDSNEKRLTHIVSFHEKATNLSKVLVYETRKRNTLYPVLDFDASVRREQLTGSPGLKVIAQIKPINLMNNGTIRLECIDHVGGRSISEIISSRDWDDINFNHTYKVYLPREFKISNMKTKLIIKRVKGEFKFVGVDSILGFDHGFEFKYEALPEDGNTMKILTSVTHDGEYYGLHHKLEPDGSASQAGDGEDNSLPRYRYLGTYTLADSSFKAKGFFLGRKGREILPFSKFDIRVASVEGVDIDVRIFGAENVMEEKIHRMKFGMNKGDSVVFEATNEMNPDDKIPMKATLILKDYGEMKLVDVSKNKHSRSLQINAKLPRRQQQVEGKIAFPTALSGPLFLDSEISIVREGGQPIFRISTNSSVEFTNKFAANSENMLQVSDSKWKFFLEGLYGKEMNSNFDPETFNHILKYDKNMTFSVRFEQPDHDAYELSFYSREHTKNRDDFIKYALEAERPNKAPLQFAFELDSTENYGGKDIDGGSLYNNGENARVLLRLRHKDNFLFVFPVLDTDFRIEMFRDRNEEGGHVNSVSNYTDTCKLRCNSNGILEHICNQINLTYKLESEYTFYRKGPWLASFKATNDPKIGLAHELNWKLHATYDLIDSVNSSNTNNDYDNMFLDALSTVYYDELMKNTYNIEYDYHHDFVYVDGGTQKTVKGFDCNGTYIFSKIFESFDNFEIFDEHSWRFYGAENFYIWTNRVNHTSDLDNSKDYASIFSQYVSLGDEGSGSRDNITYMELRSTLGSDGFGSLLTVIMKPYVLLSRGGKLDADFLIRSEFSLLKNFHLVLSHNEREAENDDDESIKYEFHDELNLIVNEREWQTTNAMTIAFGKYLAFGNSLSGRRGRGPPADRVYEYLTMKAFAVCPYYREEDSKDHLVHIDVFSGWTNADDDEIEWRILREFIYDSGQDFPVGNVPVGRLSVYKNSTILGFVRNISVLAYQSKAHEGVLGNKISSLPDNFISEGLDQLNFSQESLQSISQQIIEEYYNSSILIERDYSGNDTWPDYNLEYVSTVKLAEFFLSSDHKAKLYGIQDKVFQCKSSLEGSANVNYNFDTSNYCNLLILPAKPLAWSMVDQGKVPFWFHIPYFNVLEGVIGY